MTDWMAARMKRLGYVQKFDKSVDAERRQRTSIDRLVAARIRPQARVLGAVAVGP